jgi:hypothetical protein
MCRDDAAQPTNLRYAYDIEIFRRRHGGSRRRWVHEGLVSELRSGTNRIRVVARRPGFHAMSRG